MNLLNRSYTMAAQKMAALIAILTLFAGSCKNGDNLESAAFHTTIDSLKHVNDQTVTMLGASQIKIDQISSERNKMDSIVVLKNKEIDKLKREVARLKKTNKKAAISKKADKDSGREKEASGYAEMYQSQIKQLQAEKAALESELNTLKKSFERLKQLGSVVHASNFRIEPVKLRKGGKSEKIVTKAKKMNELKISFDIDENLITDDGNKSLYIVIAGPDGKVLSDESNQSGKFTNSEGLALDYSVKKEILVRKGKPVTDLNCTWKQNGPHEKGAYTVTVYNEGHRVGSGSVTLK
jgi:hypothetical protein